MRRVPESDRHAAGVHKTVAGRARVHVCYVNGYAVILMLKNNWHFESDISGILFLGRTLSLAFKKGHLNVQ